MNIIKFKDTVVTDLSLKDAYWYNENLRGKYAYWIRCHVVVPLEAITQNMYVSFETTINNLYGYDYYVLTYNDVSYTYTYNLASPIELSPNQKHRATLVTEVPANPNEHSPQVVKIDNSTVKYVDLWEGDYNWMNYYVDQTMTDTVNSVDVLKQYNNYVPDSDVTVDELKRFRTWIATSLLDMDYTFYVYNEGSYYAIPNPTLDERLEAKEVNELPSEDEGVVKIKNLNIVDWTENATHILTYYRDGMYDDILKWIEVFGSTYVSTGNSVIKNNCGCGSNTNISSLYQDGPTACDVPSIYRGSIKNGMVDLFSNLDTWSTLPSSYLATVKQYVDGVIQTGFGLTLDNPSQYYGCECINKSEQENGLAILRQLSVAFGYLAEGGNAFSQHKNFIHSILNQWAKFLYELMEWN